MTSTKPVSEAFSGFTLVETLLVLLVTIFLLGLPAVLSEQALNEVTAACFFARFEKYLLYTQQVAATGTTDTTIDFSEEDQTLTFHAGEESKTLKILPLLVAQGPATLVFKMGTGNNGKLASYRFEWSAKGQCITFQMQMGSGRYVKKISRL